MKKRKQSIAGETFLVSQRTSPPSATSIGAADRCRAHRLFRLTRGAPCALKAAPATGRPVVSLPPSKKAVWVRQKHAIYLCSAGKEKHASRRNPSFFVTGDVFFTATPQCKHAFRISVLQKNCPCLAEKQAVFLTPFSPPIDFLERARGSLLWLPKKAPSQIFYTVVIPARGWARPDRKALPCRGPHGCR